MTLFFIFFAVVLCFGFVLIRGAPYLPTKRKQIDTTFDLLKLKPGQTFYELGCGDGRVLNAAAKRGLRAVGYELNPILVVTARINTFRYRKQVRVVWGDFWFADLGKADAIFVFLLDRFMPQLDARLEELNKRVKLVSFAFKVPGKKIAKSKDGVFLYYY